jgi:hypothetical protein
MKTLMVLVMTLVAGGCTLPPETRVAEVGVEPTAGVLVVPASFLEFSDQVVGDENPLLVLDGAS